MLSRFFRPYLRFPARCQSTARFTTETVTLPIFQLDAFSATPFGGNPAAVLPLKSWLPDATLKAIAAENNLSETAFFVPTSGGEAFHLRWFTPTLEVDMCGHATLATAALILGKLEPDRLEAAFDTRSGRLLVRRSSKGSDDGDEALPRLTLDFPSWPCKPDAVAPPPALVDALGGDRRPVLAHEIEPMHGAPYFLFVYENASDVASLAPSFDAMEANVLATAPAGEEASRVDFVSRFFGPLSGIPEDPVTGSAHTTLAPFWASRLGKSAMNARQLSSRGGELHVELNGDRVLISGATAFYMEGHVKVPIIE
eukprot:TRINITY_DN40508_c0_g1_i1.p1 TRINITY_DN40508_c0_g1~~TRINITY_DN40508_c0_g1_i1.p1  ORF type:complete len:312 (+),score=39.72 TRINITY_DN40508_c0_g1_i1:55-990(+)